MKQPPSWQRKNHKIEDGHFGIIFFFFFSPPPYAFNSVCDFEKKKKKSFVLELKLMPHDGKVTMSPELLSTSTVSDWVCWSQTAAPTGDYCHSSTWIFTRLNEEMQEAQFFCAPATPGVFWTMMCGLKVFGELCEAACLEGLGFENVPVQNDKLVLSFTRTEVGRISMNGKNKPKKHSFLTFFLFFLFQSQCFSHLIWFHPFQNKTQPRDG